MNHQRLLLSPLLVLLLFSCTKAEGPESLIWFSFNSDDADLLYPMITALDLIIDPRDVWVGPDGKALATEDLTDSWAVEERSWFSPEDPEHQPLRDMDPELVFSLDLSDWMPSDALPKVVLDPGVNLNLTFSVWVEAFGEVDGEARVLARTWVVGPLKTSRGSPYTVPIEHLNFLPCFDQEDNDGDGWVDTVDPDCDPEKEGPNGAAGTYEVGWIVPNCSTNSSCNNGCDDDGDGWADSLDPDCTTATDDETGQSGLTGCNDGIDNDNDGAIDAGYDENGDGLYDGPNDYPQDTDCASGFGDETTPTCQNNHDDDGDGYIDAEDPDCMQGIGPLVEDFNPENLFTTGAVLSATTPPSLWPGGLLWDPVGLNGIRFPGACYDGLDNDGDGQIDAEDSACSSATHNNEHSTLFQCSDGRDNDGDGWIDINDPGCTTATGDQEAGDCDDAYDNGGSTAEVAFPGEPGCDGVNDPGEDNSTSSPICSDGIDNDLDGWIDSADAGCTNGSAQRETQPIYDSQSNIIDHGEVVTNCNNHLDDDGDGWIDSQDPGCTDGFDVIEGAESTATCSDGVDNDGDGWVDAKDPGCIDGWDADESSQSSTWSCSDGIDNDNDGWTDRWDPDCSSGNDPTEGVNDTSQCTDGVDNDGDGWVDAADLGCTSVYDWDEGDDVAIVPTPFCADGIDNDGDGWIDRDDPGCRGAWDWSESDVGLQQCNNGVDDDLDGLIDSADPECVDGNDTDESQ